MAAETQFASLDATALHGESTESQSSSSNLARRSISIFSRRGTETPEPKPPFIAQAAMRVPSQLGEKKQKKWMRRKSCSSETSSKPRGTILNAVPPARTIKLTPLEEEMATSPNEEILNAIGSPTKQTRFEWPAPDTRWSTNSIPQTQRTMSTRRKETNARIGVWRKGVTHWDEECLREQNMIAEPSLKEITGFSPLRRFPTERLNNPRPERPILSVVIPSSELLINDMTLSTIVKAESEPSVVSVAPVSLLPRIAFTSASPSIDQLEDIASPVDSPSPLRSTSMPNRPSAPMRGDTEGETPSKFKRSRESSSSTISSLARPDEESDGSYRSSATSVDVLVGNSNVCEGWKRSSPPASPDSPSVYSVTSAQVMTAPVDLDMTIVAKPTPPPLPPRNPSARAYSLIESVNILREQSRPNSMNLEPEFRDALEDSSCLAVPRFPAIDESQDEQNDDEASVQDEASSTANDVGSDLKNTPRPNESVAPRPALIRRQSSVRSVLHPPERAPTIPRRSRKRDWVVARKSNRAVYLSRRTARRRKSETHLRPLSGENEEPPMLQRRASAVEISVFTDVAQLMQTPMEALIPPAPTIVIDDASDVGTFEETEQTGDETTSNGSAEEVLLQILASLDNPQDLLNAAVINKGMYRVFQENKADLISTVLYNHSPAAWELREWSALDQADSPNLAVQPQGEAEQKMLAYRRDLRVIEALKKLILERCQTVIRRETAFALSTPTHPHAQRFNDAFWRIWCFCKIFGCGKGREEDITGQLDWLKGGLLAHNQNLSATMNINLDFEMGSVLLNAPEYFAESNRGGLSARQLYDMTELWACMTTLLEGYHFRTEQAWDSGVFEDCGIGCGDDQTEEELLEEWTSHLLTLGPKVVLEMAEYANDNSCAGFTLARIKGWTKWSPPSFTGSRSTFLKEPVSRLYEERVTATAAKLQNSTEEEKKEMSRKRVATLAAEIKLARQSSTYKRLPFIDMAMERPMSAFSRSNSLASTTSIRTGASMSSTRRQQRNTIPSPSAYVPSPLAFAPPRRRPSRRTLWSPRKISPIIEDRVETFNRMALESCSSSVPDDAVRHLVDMGFSVPQAREALRMTRSGEGLRMDLAVDVLLSASS